MSEPKQPLPNEDRVRFDSGNCDLLELTEENTRPGKLSEASLREIEKRYGRKPPPNPPDPPDPPPGPDALPQA